MEAKDKQGTNNSNAGNTKRTEHGGLKTTIKNIHLGSATRRHPKLGTTMYEFTGVDQGRFLVD
jgi:hypothetical protein